MLSKMFDKALQKCVPDLNGFHFDVDVTLQPQSIQNRFENQADKKKGHGGHSSCQDPTQKSRTDSLVGGTKPKAFK